MRSVAVGFALVLGSVLAWQGPAEAQLTCHQTIYESVEFTGDLDCSGTPGDALIVGADNLTIKLNGYTLTCPPGYVNSGGELDVEGIIMTGRSGVQILGPGKIVGCGRAVTIWYGADNLVRGLYLTENFGGGVVLLHTTRAVVRDNVIVGNLVDGIAISGAVDVQIVENYIAANGGADWPGQGFGITNDNTSTATIANNYILGNPVAGIGEQGASDLAVQISNNIILGNGQYDLYLRGTNDFVTGTICETSVPAGLCPYPFPRFPFETVPKGKGHPK